MEKFEFTGKNLDQAISLGLKELNKKREDVDIKIISQGGLFSKAKIEIIVDDEKEIVEKNIVEEVIENIKEKVLKKTENVVEEEVTLTESNEAVEESESHEEVLTEKVEKVYLTSEQVIERIQEFFKGVFDALKIEAKVVVMEEEENFQVKIMGEEKVSSLIGYRGEALTAYQYLINNLPSLKDKSKRILLDVENYRNRREENLRNLADRTAKKVLRNKRSFKFEPMNAYERRIIHDEVSKIQGVTTHSEGVEPHRFLIIELEK